MPRARGQRRSGQRLPRAEFQALARRALADLPGPFRLRLENVAILIEEEPPEPLPPDTMGLYEGVPLPERVLGEPMLPDRITLYRGPIQRACRTPQEVTEEVRRTILHEVGHFFGLGEESLD